MYYLEITPAGPSYQSLTILHLLIIQSDIAEGERGGDCIMQAWLSKAVIRNRTLERADSIFLKGSLLFKHQG